MISATFPVLTIFSGIFVSEKRVLSSTNEGLLTRSKKNLKIIYKNIKSPSIFKPLIFILLVIIAPGVDNAMFYYNSNFLKFSSDVFANISLVTQIGSIFGQQFYRLIKDLGFRKILTISTLLYSLNSALKLFIVFD